MIFLSTTRLIAATLAAGGLLGLVQPAAAQSNPGYFIPPQAAGPRASAPAPVARPAPRPAAPVQQTLAPPPPVQIPSGLAGVGSDANAEQPGVQLPNLPVPDLPPLPRGTTPPAAVVGVLGVPEIMRAATAAQQVEKVIAERRERLNEDAQKEQTAWRDLQAQIATLPPEQARTRQKDLQDRITNAQKSFRDRNRIIQEQAQYCLSQIERTLIGVIRQVSESRGMNLVLHRAQVALNVNEFDITDQVTQQMNKVMPSVAIPAEGVSPVTVAQAGTQAPAPTPASAPATAPTARRP